MVTKKYYTCLRWFKYKNIIMKKSTYIKRMNEYCTSLQKTICDKLEKIEKNNISCMSHQPLPHAKNTRINYTKMKQDKWKRPGGGGGVTRVLSDGTVFEKVGVNVSFVHGVLPTKIAENLNHKVNDNFSACGLSIIIHPCSPRIPTVHLNIRYIETGGGRSWFGGGIDLTPYYPHEEDFSHFHNTLFKAVEAIQPNHYNIYKEQCDQYFHIKHRNEMRGIGGIFFDYLEDNHKVSFSLIQSIGDHFLRAYEPIVLRRVHEIYTEQDKKFQLIRRGRYIEFNLVYDRGTLFGLETNGRIESILVSLPPQASHLYNFKPSYWSPHKKMLKYYQPKKWTSF